MKPHVNMGQVFQIQFPAPQGGRALHRMPATIIWQYNKRESWGQVQAHGGQVYPTSDGSFFWIGEGAKPGCSAEQLPYATGCSPQILEVSDGINLYVSRDLQNWNFLGVVASNTAIQDPFCGGPVCRMERPKVCHLKGPVSAKLLLLLLQL